MSKFKLQFTLKQHTPIIHFQADQAGATLRATELKPKLDRFLIEHVFKNDFEQYKEFLIGYKKPKGEKDKKLTEKDFEGKKAFDYKVRVEPNGQSANKNDKDLKNYFGNQGEGAKKYPKIYNKTFTIEIKAFNKELLKKIKEYFAPFLAITNFGTRQTKGYGSFYLDENSNGYKPIEDVLPKETYFLEVDKSANVDEVIKYFWNRLKSGINPNFSSLQPNEDYKARNKNCKKGYEKAFVAKQINNWDKPWVKQTFFAEKTNDNYVFARALLGLSTRFSYKRINEPCKPGSKYLTIEDDYIIDVYHKDIGRIKSPLLFKPIKGNKLRIYLIVDDLHIQQLLIKQNEPFMFVKKFDFIKDAWIDKRNRNKFKTKKISFPPFDIKKQNIHYPIPQEITNTIEKEDFEKFSYKEQYKRFQHFLNNFSDKQDENYKAKTFSLPLPVDFNFENFLQKYINNELKNSFNINYKENKNFKNFTVSIERI